MAAVAEEQAKQVEIRKAELERRDKERVEMLAK